METNEWFWDAALVERLRYVEALVEMMDGGSGIDQKALAGSATIWISALDETLCKANPDCGGEKYSVRRNNEAGGRTVRALRLARNEVAHGSGLVSPSGISVPVEIPMVFRLKFVSTSVLAARHLERKGEPISAHNLALYERHVDGKEPKTVLLEAYNWLDRIAAS